MIGLAAVIYLVAGWREGSRRGLVGLSVRSLWGPIAPAMSAPTVAGVLERDAFVSVINAKTALRSGLQACSDAHVGQSAGALDELAIRFNTTHIALAFVGNERSNPPTRYGHVWEYLNALYCQVFLPRASGGWKVNLTLFVHAGNGPDSRLLEEAETLFGGNRARALYGVQLKRARWVPLCLKGKCVRFGGMPAKLHRRIFLLDGVVPGPALMGPACSAEFREHALRVLGFSAQGAGTWPKAPHWRSVAEGSRRPLLLYARSGRNSNRRRIAAEDELVAVLRTWAAETHPALDFVAIDVHAVKPYASELALFARAALVVSLFGSTTHNCRFMAPGSTYVEIHGALHNDFGTFDLYRRVCAVNFGILHAPWQVPGAVPERSNGTLVFADGRNTPFLATFQPKELVRFVARVFPPDACATPVPWERVLTEYDAAVGFTPDKRGFHAVGKGGRLQIRAYKEDNRGRDESSSCLGKYSFFNR
mmetsp:Transcript_25112/g.73724  ORF Transcript_25112/g.73724 Transcript_25112/m.73724 type:complete len:478 (+) Transcript_25112:115-1548(+)